MEIHSGDEQASEKKSKYISKSENKLYIDMGMRLRKTRLKFDYTQEQVAEMLGISTTYYGKIERGVHGLSLVKLLAVHQKLKVDITYLLTGDEQPNFVLEHYVQKCPAEKRYDLEQLIKYALNLANEK